MATDDDRIDALRKTRADYVEEAKWHKFLLDAVYGTGGFKGRVGATEISHLGWAAEAYAEISKLTHADRETRSKRFTYLDQFAREDHDKFDRRIDVAHYTNYVGPIHNILLAYVNKGEMNRDELGDTLAEWMQDVDGRGEDWEGLQRETIRPRASLLGWCPVLFDTPSVDVSEPLSLEQQIEGGIMPRAIPLFPVNLLDWMCDEDGRVTAVKIRTDHWERDNLLGKHTKRERYALWYEDRVERYSVVTVEGERSKLEVEPTRAHAFGRVPLIVFRANATPDDKVRGVSTVANSAVAARRLFNLESEMDDHIRGQVFATLGLPVQDVGADIGEIIGGNGSVLKIPMTSNMPLHYVAPPASVAAALETRIEVTVREIYRTENVEHAKSTGTTSASGVARAYEFEQTNRRLSGISGAFARDEQDALRMVNEMLGGSGVALTVTAPTDFSVEDLSAEIQSVLDAVGLRLGTTAEREMKRRLVSRMLPNLPRKLQAQVDEELDRLAQEAASADAFDREQRRAQVDPSSGTDTVDEPFTGGEAA